MNEENQNGPKLPEMGTYKARRASPIAVKETDAGALCAYIQYQLLGSSIAHVGEDVRVLGKQDGTLQQATWENLAAIFPEWQPREDGQLNPYDLCTILMTPDGTPEFLAKDCFHDEYPAGSGKMKFKIQWLNPLGSNRVVTPEEQAATESKWGGKFKLAASLVKKVSAPAEPAVEKPAAAPVVEAPAEKTKPPGRSKKSAPAAPVKAWTADSTYNEFLKKHGDPSDAGVIEGLCEKVWYVACDELFGNGNLPSNDADWAKLAAKLDLQ